VKAVIRAVTFDVGGTLIQPWPSVGQVYADEAARQGWPGVSAVTLNLNFQRAWRQRDERFSHTAREWAALVDSTFAGLVNPPPSRSFFPALYDRFTRADTWRIFDDVLPTLRSLQANRLRLLVISNWDERLRPLLGELGLTRYFEDLLISLELGFTKPDPEIFLETARRLKMEPSHILHVGDDPVADTQGARQAGFQARTILRQPDSPAGDQCIQSLTELISLTRSRD
jgi:putative hydrolase of the HAD superfamily